MTVQMRDMYLSDHLTMCRWQEFLESEGIHEFQAGEVRPIEETVGLFDEDGRLIATGSLAGCVLKYIAVRREDLDHSALFNRIVGELIARLADRGATHYFVFTKPMYVTAFEHIGFTKLAQVEQGVLLEGGLPGIDAYLKDVRALGNWPQSAAIVMNANPFTLGHRHLVEVAASRNRHVYVFVVHADRSLFTTDERLELVRQGVADIRNVTVVDGGDYLVGFATFPAYFIASPEDVVDYQTKLDATLFRDWFVPALGITRRYVGQEPYSPTTEAYNKALKEVLEPRTQVTVIEREQAGGEPISASRVRQLVAQGDLDGIDALVPATTRLFIQHHLLQLQMRI
ncbi:[citrate (pro-3S)-lyase] ligase [Bifidobacterium bohemicum]|uniref:[Citrate [pro-3S]-lyase] ligase n=1 Tax=Bifidobacterium bohemicum DSM 22767 TaxID=1437606 RepID=A0A086ZEV5_9BIFI|nr:[citrate (pro-3S)-lyase] ligase [Bifidobacterium bohemicum]KFI45055.1 [citrate (pro-3S)-lyase] ligase [Bifidobacterium bohemicum DSM 22767]SCB92619.1 [citrate (pro-3S)-lyase] ligase [Bifidobacterium bohemicum]